MIITFTGAQSTGKSTLLEKMKHDQRFRKFNFVPEITRNLNKRYNLDINEDGDEYTQLMIMSNHLDNYLTHRNNNVVLDRCALDGFLYTVYLMNNSDKISNVISSYAEYIHKKLIDKYDIIFYTEPDIPLIDDGQRSASEDFRNTMINLFEEAIDHYKINITRLKGTVEERLETIYNTYDNYGK